MMCWEARACKGSGRDMDADFAIHGVEPAARRSQGPAAYDPRLGVAVIRPSVSSGGAFLRDARASALMPVKGRAGFEAAYVYKGLPPTD